MTLPFSIIIPSHNEGAWLERTVLGVLENTDYPEFEIVIVADGCTDDSTEFLRQKTIPNVRLLDLDAHVGAAPARNHGAKAAEGDLFVFLDSHMVPVDANWLYELAVQLEDGAVGAASLKIPYLEEPDRVSYIYTLKDLALEPTWVTPDPQTGDRVRVPAISGACFGMRRDVFEKTGGFDVGLQRWGREDFEYSLRLWRLGYDLTLSQRAGVAHSWERRRTFTVSWEQVDYNILRTALTLLSDEWTQNVIAHLRTERPQSVGQALSSLEKDTGFQMRKDTLQAQFVRGFDEYIQAFAPILPILETVPENERAAAGA